MWEIYHKKFSNACIDSYYGKSYKYTVIGVVVDTEENVKAFVQKLNDENHSYWAKEEPSDEFDEDFCDEDNYGYKEFKTTTIEELNWKFGR